MNDKVKIIGAVLLFAAFGSSALTLGRVRGAALVGQPLEVAVPIQMEAGEDPAALCFEADVFHADTRQDASRVRLRIEPSAQPNAALVRVLSASVVDEPVVTVYLRTGCGQKTTRRYVLLADLPSETTAPVAPRTALVAALPSASAKATPSAPADLDAAASAPVTQAKPTRAPKAKARAQGLPAAQAVDAMKSASPSGQSRLKLDPLELLSDRVANLDSFMTFEPPEDAVRSTQRIQALEATVKAAQALVAKNEASLLDLQVRLQKAESERYPAGLMYGLIALVLSCLAALAYIWHRQRSVQDRSSTWWHASADASASAAPDTVSEPPAKSAQDSKFPKTAIAARAALVDVTESLPPMSVLSDFSGASSKFGVNLTEMTESTFGDFIMAGHGRSAAPQAPPVLPVGLGQKPVAHFNSDAVLDIRQQAEFFVSLGQTDHAVRILKSCIKESATPNPFLYLDLLDIFHSLSLKVDFQQVREDFNRIFTGKVPEFLFFKNQGQSLEFYPDVLSHITTLWPTPQVLAAIEVYVFRDARVALSQEFELAAFRELLLLHSMAESLLLVPEPDPENVETRHGDLTPVATPFTGELDLDLSEPPSQGAPFVSKAVPERPSDGGNLVQFDFPDIRRRGP